MRIKMMKKKRMKGAKLKLKMGDAQSKKKISECLLKMLRIETS